ncbi:MAG TPA: ATP-binding protein [Gammaproteobacteria bacterium]|nr:ATP-binding protein [Gammaproteobacteria bacterium]
MAANTLRRPRLGLTWVAILFILLFASLYLVSDITQNSEQFGRIYYLLLILNGVGLVILAVLIGIQLTRLVRQYRAGAAGSRLTVRLVIMFVVLSVAPVSMVFYFSVGFLRSGIDSWFDVRVEQALSDALDLSRAALDVRLREMLRQTELLADELADATDTGAALILNDLRGRSAAEELTLLAQNGRIIASSSADPTMATPSLPPERVLAQVRQGRNYVALDPIRDAGLHVRVVVSVPVTNPNAELRVLQALAPIAERQSRLADSVQSAFAQYKKLAFLRKPLKDSFTMTLSLVLALSLLSAVWAAFFSTRRLVAPIRDLAEGTRAVAAGDYDKRLPVSSNDELGFLVQSFNVMTRKIAQARDAVSMSRQQAESQRVYLTALLERLSSGVLTLDSQQHLRTANAAASQLLNTDLGAALGRTWEEIAAAHPHLAEFGGAIGRHLSAPAQQDWREECVMTTPAGRQTLMCRGTLLPGADGAEPDYLVVFDDVTALIQAQRDAAWGEVARRLAHEFKNPLTPIQLSAERLRHKYLKTMDAKDAEVLDRSTHTIVQQVEVMKDMVNSFAEYARNPQMQPRPLQLNQLVNEVLDLYRGGGAGAQFYVRLEPDLPLIEADPGRLRQLLHNLIKNSLEAMSGKRGSRIIVGTRSVHDHDHQFVELWVEDRGPGIPEEIMAQLFEPYVTTKPKGTGLGLAIVKKIVEEHGGTLTAENPKEGGACLKIRFPVLSTAQVSDSGTAA